MTVLDDVRGLDDTGLRDMYRAADDAAARAALAEARRRDQADRAARARDALAAVRAEGEAAAYAQYLEADKWTRGRLLSRDGMRAGIRDEQALWRMSESELARYASEELTDFFLYVQPRITPGGYVRQRAAQMRLARAEALETSNTTDEGSSITDEHDNDAGAGLAGDEEGALRRGPVAGQAPQHAGRPVLRGGHRAEQAARREYSSTSAGRPDGPVRGYGRVSGDGAVNVIEVARDVGTTARVAEYFEGAREEAARRMEQARQAVAAGSNGTLAAPERSPAVRSAGTVARREPGQIPGDQLLDLIRDKWFGRYARFPSTAALDVVTLWAAHCHMRDAEGVLVSGATPRLYLLSSEPGSGKSRVLELLGMIVPACFGLDVEPTKAGLVYSLAREHATVLIDEGDIMFGAGQRRADVRAVLNAGYRRHGTVLTGKGAKASREPVFGPVAVAGLDTMVTDTGEALKALLTRGIKIAMRKAATDDKPAKLTRGSEAEAVKAARWLAAWAGQVRDEVAGAQPDMPEDLDGRTEEIWEPLIAVADAAGGEWPARARAALAELAMAAPVTEDGDEDQADEFAEFAASFGADSLGEDD